MGVPTFTEADLPSLLATVREAQARADEATKALRELATEIACPCMAPKGPVGHPPRLADDEEPTCGRPARWGILSAWTCTEHRRPDDRNEIGIQALRNALALLERG